MDLEVDLELLYYKLEVVQTALETKHQITTYSDPLPLPVKAYQVWNKDTATLKERHKVYYMDSRNSVTNALQER